nr:MAG TPA: major capsid protein [Caudoviricetes sp.]
MINLATLATNSGDKLTQGFINELVTDNYLLGALTFDDCMNASGTSDLVYGYKRVKTPSSAAFRALGAEPVASEPTVEKKTTTLGILGSTFQMDRVAKAAADDLYEMYLEQAKDAVSRKFNASIFAPTKDANGFDGLAAALKTTSTEMTSKTDVKVTTKEAALAYLEELDTMLSNLMRTPDVLMMNAAQYTKLNALLRVVGLGTESKETAGNVVQAYNGIAIHEVRDGSITDGSIYAACLGMDGFHGITLNGDNAFTVALPDWTTPGAVKNVDVEFVCGVALKATKAAGVLKPKAA